MGHGDAKYCTPTSLGVFMGGLVLGTYKTVFTKVLYETHAVGVEGFAKPFRKPVTTVFFIFLAMAVSLPLFWLKQRAFPSKQDPDERISFSLILKLGVLSVMEVLGTFLGQLGLLFTSASLYQLLRCSILIVSALVKVTFFQEKLSSNMWIGLAINSFAMLLGSLSIFFGDRDEAVFGSNPDLGFTFIALSVFVVGAQYVLEEKIMDEERCSPMIVVGVEGVWGCLICLVFLFPLFSHLPGLDAGAMENINDSWVMVKNSPHVQFMICMLMISVAGYYILSMYLTSYLSGIWHAILDCFRSASVWATNVTMFYCFGFMHYGEALSRYSFLQFGGLVCLLVGTLVYNGSLSLGHDQKKYSKTKALDDNRWHFNSKSGKISSDDDEGSLLLSSSDEESEDMGERGSNARRRDYASAVLTTREGSSAQFQGLL